MAGVVPGIMLAIIFAVYCMTANKLAAKPVPTEPRASLAEVIAALRRSFWSLTLPATVLGGMYFGVFTATEAAAAGALGALLIAAFVYRNFGLADLWHSAIDAARNSAMLFLILAAAALLGNVLTKLRIPNQMVDLVTQYGVSQVGFLLAVMALVFVLGMFLETISIILITTPVVLPVLAALKIDPVWYGILLTINLELALITPPVGMNLFAIKAITRAGIGEIIAGVAPYVGLLILGLLLVLFVPAIALWLPGTMNYK
jgi:C4-dicarboxylate transporter DctM subunit